MKAYIISASKRVAHEWGDVITSPTGKEWRKAICGQTMQAGLIDANTFSLPWCKKCEKRLGLNGGGK